jgi:hypothetical protein
MTDPTEQSHYPEPRSTRARSVAAVLLILLSAISLVAASVGIWAHYVALDTDSFMSVIDPVLGSDDFLDPLSNRLSTDIIDALDLETRLERRLGDLDQFITEGLAEALDPRPIVISLIRRLDPPRFADLAGPISAAANQKITQGVDTLVHDQAFQTVVHDTIRKGHSAFVALATDDVESLNNLYVESGVVRLNMLPPIRNALVYLVEQGLLDGEELTLPDLSDNPIASIAIRRFADSLDVKLPQDFGQITILSAGAYRALRAAADSFDKLVWGLVATWAVVAAGALILSTRRRRTLIQIAIASVAGLVVAGVIVRATVGSLRNALIDPNSQTMLGAITTAVDSSLRRTWLIVGVVALVVGVTAYLLGRPGWVASSIETSRELLDPDRPPHAFEAFVGRHLDGLSVLAIIIALLLLTILGLGVLPVVVVFALLGLFIWFGQNARRRIGVE